MATIEPRHKRSTEIERLIFFSDAVFAIAMTLLVIDIKVPEIPEGQAVAELPRLVWELSPSMFSYVVSFLVIAIYWVAHHRIFSYIRRYDGRLLWHNLYFLMFIAFLPFPTSLLGRYGDTFFAIACYVAAQVAVGVTLALIWDHATRGHRLVDPDLDPDIIRGLTVRNLGVPLIFLLSLGVAAIDTTAGKLFWLMLLLIGPAVRRVSHNAFADD